MLHKYGADINLKGFGRDTPLHDAARNGQIKVSNNNLFFIKVVFTLTYIKLNDYGSRNLVWYKKIYCDLICAK